MTRSFQANNAPKGNRLQASRVFLKAAAAAAIAGGLVAAAPAAAADPATATAAATAGAFDAVSTTGLAAKADPMFRTLFDSWKRMDAVPHGVLSVPSQQPVKDFRFSSRFGVRVDPFNHNASMHPGLDMAAPKGTPVYATADGIVDRAERAGGYGNMVEINHGKGVQTRYGHLSQILVHDGQRVHRGDLIALVGSTGRSTGPHLHYEVRIDGRAVNPMPFLQTAAYMTALKDRTPLPGASATAMGGPEDPDGG